MRLSVNHSSMLIIPYRDGLLHLDESLLCCCAVLMLLTYWNYGITSFVFNGN